MTAFIDEAGRILGIVRRDLLEKDFLLHCILAGIAKDDLLGKELAFKGGTCLIKSYLGYYRFSEDLDFTWLDQGDFAGKSRTAVRVQLSHLISDIGGRLQAISERCGLNFACEKGNRRFVDFTGGNKMVTFKLWYDSDALKMESFIKIQLNFVELLKYPPVKRTIASLLGKDLPELRVMFPDEYRRYSAKVSLLAYDIREIFCEKVRSILTRTGAKARDFVDEYLIVRRFGIRPDELIGPVVDKIRFITKLYARYKSNLDRKRRLIRTGPLFDWGRERDFMLTDMDERDFSAFQKEFDGYLKMVLEELGT